MLGFAGFGTAKVGITWFTNVNAQFNEACMFEAKSSIVLPQQAIKEGTKEVQIVYRLELVSKI